MSCCQGLGHQEVSAPACILADDAMYRSVIYHNVRILLNVKVFNSILTL